ncbi:MAG: hypothetical protein HY22_02250 [[Candidatus Thermochlorobacteriaceae] bacterium GBChlB]|nr:MAG: hypothetical protein HY22_02250 [[Candidatus Thermochlorobacteriaceae] bacterium GBChlB]
MAELELPEAKTDRQRRVGLVISIIAIVLAINTALGNKSDNDEILARVQESNTWARYQAKKIRSTQTELTRDLVQVQMLHQTPDENAASEKLIKTYTATIERYEQENKDIASDANAYKVAGDKAERQGNLHDIGDIFLQIAIVLCSISVLTDQSIFYRVGIGFGLIGVAIGGYAFLS